MSISVRIRFHPERSRKLSFNRDYNPEIVDGSAKFESRWRQRAIDCKPVLRTERGETVFNEIDEDSGFFLLLLCDAQEPCTSHEQLELKEPFVAPFFPLPLLFWLRINDHPFRIIRDRCGCVVTR